MRIEQVMTSPVSAVAPETPVKDVAMWLVRHGFGAVPVAGSDGRLIGIITEADLMAIEETPDPGLHARRDLPEEAPSPHTAADVMTTPVIAVRVGTDTADVIRIMRTEHLTRVPVLDEDSRPAGIVSRSDLVRLLTRPDAEIEVDVRRILAPWPVVGVTDIRVAAGEVTLDTSTGPGRPLLDHLIRAIPGVISVRYAPTTAGASA
ncbi:CBS domain-containing protein [Frankia sp. AgB1.9]|uniref:CBS domain-containing protein n=1 Tax=unclassified Frankia TaxID=2632575 RepID=UPI001934387F|nr:MULTISPECIES: CBS domain-containing protein [unclassified Frankia]MBL7488034.1 CBS domain-containing protein [Frankia sp. AgW1.1]MBL7549472.1 CBS domain-containing protein [Frankia sp. AgB1.9]MBL7619912.1 CBS domain-containing protein [Frankia sp. AgB1.8]